MFFTQLIQTYCEQIIIREIIRYPHQALIAVLSGNESFACAGASSLIASLVVVGARKVAGTLVASLGIVGAEIPETVLATIATGSVDVRLAVTLASDQSALGIFLTLANSVVQRAALVALTRCN